MQKTRAELRYQSFEPASPASYSLEYSIQESYYYRSFFIPVPQCFRFSDLYFKLLCCSDLIVSNSLCDNGCVLLIYITVHSIQSSEPQLFFLSAVLLWCAINYAKLIFVDFLNLRFYCPFIIPKRVSYHCCYSKTSGLRWKVATMSETVHMFTLAA